MTVERFLLLDCDFLCHRVFHAFRTDLPDKFVKTQVVYGFFRDILNFQDILGTSNIIFCFDHGESLRKQIYPSYKSNRKRLLNREEETARQQLHQQIHFLKTSHLKRIGFRNILFQKGYEADDHIANVVNVLDKEMKQECIIVSSDSDLYQLLSEKTWMWNPRTHSAFTAESLKKKYGVGPEMWATVKAIAGCNTDGIHGVKGVGDVTAAKHLLGTLPRTTKAHCSIVENKDIVARNLQLTSLPLKGLDPFILQEDEVTRKGWEEVTVSLGIVSLERLYAQAVK